VKRKLFASILCVIAVLGFISGCVEEEPKVENIVETAKANTNFDTLVDALGAADLDETLASEQDLYTVFAPTDAAFAELDEEYLANLVNNDTATLTKILTYHVVSGKLMSTDLSNDTRLETIQGKYITINIEGGNVYVDDANVTSTDIECSNGVIHIIDTVIVPKQNIVETANADVEFNTLVDALVAADLDETLASEQELYTVFAPTDAAFAELDEEYLADLLNNDTANLTKILKYHVISGKLMSTDLSDGMNLTTLEGTNVSIIINGTDVMINDANATSVDIVCSNGVIHVIDKVIVPT
jgi:transforming growth factor-beta-induced protein